jgi:hypothetical protein
MTYEASYTAVLYCSTPGTLKYISTVSHSTMHIVRVYTS